jgi:hypothetical protein
MRHVGLYGSSAKNNPTTTRRIVMTTRKTRTTKQNEEIGIAFAFAEYDAHKRRVRDQREKRDRDLATSVGIEIGIMRESDRRKARENKIWDRGFIVGVLVAVACILIGLYSASLAEGATRPAPTAIPATAAQSYPPHWRTWLRIGMCEQPKRGISWHDVKTDKQRIRSIAWGQNYNYSFPGGLGFTRQNWDDFKPPSAKRIALMSDATIAQQLWAAERLWRWAERTYPGNGHTAWVCSFTIGWTTSDPDDAIR